ncbi:MAG TPA: PDZ domain-containing protein, partial [Vicinamibacteria bacterium]|nr:PDZ domain-containing protein [Vicinamibacteria bacterium]
ARSLLRLSSATAALAAAPPPPPAASEPVPGALTMERRDLERRLALETSRILAETALVPVQNGSQVDGFAITRMPEGTLLSEAGLRAGDVVTEINGTAIDSLATLISLWPRLQNETTVRAVVLRGGQPLTLTLSVR